MDKGSEALKVGDKVTLPYHPFGTDSLGRDLLARLMYGARTSYLLEWFAPILFVLSESSMEARGFLGGALIPSPCASPTLWWLALPAFMILFRIAFGIGPAKAESFLCWSLWSY
jgi:ABC-type dipeptide/oligopeptide/nickel transport system permease subunit